MITRSKSLKMHETGEIRAIIEAALRPIYEELRLLPSKSYIDGAISKLESRFREQDDKITELTERVAALELEVTKVRAYERRIDDAEQYSRRLCLRIDNVPVDDKETSEECLNKVMHVIDNMDVDISREMIDRAHRIGKKFVREKTEDSDNSEVTDNEDREVPGMSSTRYQQIIVRFTSWRVRTLVYRKRKSARNKVKIKLDLTKRRLNLIKFARRESKEHDKVDFVFADVNCNIYLKSKRGEYISFQSTDEFEAILQTLWFFFSFSFWILMLYFECHLCL